MTTSRPPCPAWSTARRSSIAAPPAMSIPAFAARPRSCSTAGCCECCTRCGPTCWSLRRDCSTDILARLEEAGERSAVRSIMTGRRVAYVGGAGRGHRRGWRGRGDRAGHPQPADASGRLSRRPAGGSPKAPAGRVLSSPGDAAPQHTPCAEGSSSTGRASVSKTGGWGFESLLPCEIDQDRTRREVPVKI